jgi:hypothetical protein
VGVRAVAGPSGTAWAVEVVASRRRGTATGNINFRAIAILMITTARRRTPISKRGRNSECKVGKAKRSEAKRAHGRLAAFVDADVGTALRAFAGPTLAALEQAKAHLIADASAA